MKPDQRSRRRVGLKAADGRKDSAQLLRARCHLPMTGAVHVGDLEVPTAQSIWTTPRGHSQLNFKQEDARVDAIAEATELLIEAGRSVLGVRRHSVLSLQR